MNLELMLRLMLMILRGKKAVWTHRVLLILFDDVKVILVNIVYDNCFDAKSVALRVAEGA